MADFTILLHQISERPTHCKPLVHGAPGYLAYVDACNFGVGDAWLPGTTNAFHPTMWQFQWPATIQTGVIMDKNPNGTITIDNLKLTGFFVFQFLALKELIGLSTHQHIAVWCDNTPTISWVRKMKSSKSAIGQRLAEVLSLQMRINEVSPLPIVGIRINLAELVPHSFTNSSQPHAALALVFSPISINLSQNTNWHLFQLLEKIVSRVCSQLLNKQLPMALQKRLPKRKSRIGSLGSSSARELKWIRGSTVKQKPAKSKHSLHLRNGSRLGRPWWNGQICSMDPGRPC